MWFHDLQSPQTLIVAITSKKLKYKIKISLVVMLEAFHVVVALTVITRSGLLNDLIKSSTGLIL